MRPLSLRAEVAKQLMAGAAGVLAGENPLRRIRKALRLLSAPSEGPAAGDRGVLEAGFRVVRLAPIETARPLCLLVTYAPDGRPFPHTLRLCGDLRRAGLTLILIVATDRPDLDCLDPGPDVVDGLVVRANEGYDFAAWAATLRHIPEAWDAAELWFANDSVYHSAPALAELLQRARQSPAAAVALTGSTQIAPHFQSYFFLLKPAALTRAPVREFWWGVRAHADKNAVIRAYEVGQKAMLEAAGVEVDILFPASAGGAENQLQTGWRALLDEGFPFVKIELLRDNPHGADLTGWRDLLAARGFSVEDIAFHLGARADGAAALLALK
ncbi:rhamnan synthesis F family protein [Aquabacter spiritensis]|uniref:Rhamnan synthesis protein F n=1 Tax=Aquabacter spiritensis TaxID=933073 RepID=A0A4R3M823_9HYPH|nr:rhamnan synthesis F family protein [Aquabacter spiritensis]TCT07787.1 rhamnan synthesis protein F [Aquabacter spiritensis]